MLPTKPTKNASDKMKKTPTKTAALRVQTAK